MVINTGHLDVLNRVLESKGVSKVMGHVKVTHTGRAPVWPKLLTDVQYAWDMAGTPLTISQDQLQELCGNCLEESGNVVEWQPQFPTVNTISDLIQQGMEHYRIILGPNGESIRRDGIDIQYDIFESLLKEYTREYEEDSKVPGQKEAARKVFQAQRIGDALKVFVSNRDLHARDALRKRIYYREEYGSNCYAFHMVKRVMELFEVKEDHDLSTVMVMQWMWQTKRYALSQEVLEPIMINFMGAAQGTMKTSFIEALTTPFKQYRKTDAKLRDVTDEREYTLWAKKYVIIFDELQKGRMNKGEMGSLITAMKSLLTAKTVGGRVMKTTHHIEMQRIFSPIASSNASIVSVIRDKTGMRRFFEMNVMTSVRAHPELITIVNALLDPSGAYAEMVWGSINEHLPQGYMESGTWKEQLVQVQDTYTVVDNVDLWLHSGDLRDIPVKRDVLTPESVDYHMKRLMGCNTKKDIMVLNKDISPMSWQLDYELTKDATEWVEEAMGKNAAQFVGGREHMIQYLESNNHITCKCGLDTYALCNSDMLLDIADTDSKGGI